jgi:hypothetical protein
MIVDINGNGFKKPALTDDGFKFLVTLNFHENHDLIYSNEQSLTYCREALTMELIIPKSDVDNISKLDKYNRFKAKLEAMLQAVSVTCLALAKPGGQSESEGVE